MSRWARTLTSPGFRPRAARNWGSYSYGSGSHNNATGVGGVMRSWVHGSGMLCGRFTADRPFTGRAAPRRTDSPGLRAGSSVPASGDIRDSGDAYRLLAGAGGGAGGSHPG